MPLSEYEQRVLDEMEQSLSTENPRLAANFTRSPRQSPLRYVVAILGTLVGIGLLVAGVATGLAIVGVVGFLVMFVAVALALAWPGRTKQQQGSSTKGTRRTERRGRSSWMGRIEERWDKRQSGS